jgi:hypothetical protein
VDGSGTVPAVADTAVSRTEPESVWIPITAASGKVIMQVPATGPVQLESNIPKKFKPTMDEPVKKLNVSPELTEPMIVSFMGLPLATTATPKGESMAQSALVHGVPGALLFSPSPLSAKVLAGIDFSVNAPPPAGLKGFSIPVAVKVLPAAVNDCVLAQTEPESPPDVVQLPGDGVKLPKSTSAASAASAPPMARTARMAKKTNALANLIMTHPLLNRDDESSISPIIIQYSPVLGTPFLQREFPKRISHSNHWS